MSNNVPSRLENLIIDDNAPQNFDEENERYVILYFQRSKKIILTVEIIIGMIYKCIQCNVYVMYVYANYVPRVT